MSQMADITVKNVANADVVYVAATPSAGDKVPARWTQNAVSGITGFRPRLDLVTQSNGKGDVRRAEFTYVYPTSYTNSATGQLQSNGSVKFTGVVYLPVALADTDWNEAFTQLGNLLVSTLIRDSVKGGYAPT